MRTLAVNAGSTSMKVSLLDGEQMVREHDSLDDALEDDRRPDAVVHRVVHGGERTAAAAIDDQLLADLYDLVELAPLHQPPALHAIDQCRSVLPDVPQVACFDTAFHTTIPAAARTYALPERFRAKVRVFGFHGLSHAWAAQQVAAIAPEVRRIVIAHLGGGQSLCGVLDGRSVITTMGFTPLDGLVMSTRSGAIDPGAVLWLAKHTDEDLEDVFERQSGLLGLCGTGDMRELLARRDDQAKLALDVYLHRLITQLGGCVAALGGLDGLVFTGGIGEHSTQLRTLVSDRLGWLGVEIDEQAPGDDITARGAAVRAFVIPPREDVQMVREATSVLGQGSTARPIGPTLTGQ